MHRLVIFIRRYVNKLIHVPKPKLICGSGKITATVTELKARNAVNVMIVSDQVLTELGFTQQLVILLQNHNISVQLFDQVTPDPNIALVEQGCEQYLKHSCDGIVALGGGSVIDCAKAIAASATKRKPVKALAGLFRVRTSLPPFIAIPTTAGTGSEATLVAVITDSEQRKKFTVIDPCLVPHVAILDANLMVGLPAEITANTGMDALTHAIESYIGLHSTSETRAYSLAAMERIFTYLPLVYTQGNDSEARQEMAIASYEAGLAFTRTSVGYVHAIAHQLGAIYHIPHGLANAVVLPHILDFSFEQAYPAYAEIAYQLKLVAQNTDKQQAAIAFVERVKALSQEINIPTRFSQLKVEDIEEIAQRAINEAYCDYPVPKVMSVLQCQQIVKKMLTTAN
nr:iron-containing alcohol dehydrogenase [Thalassotalea sp. G2M2-11]